MLKSILVLSGVFLIAACKFQPGIGYNQGYKPEQPIAFDHSLHVGTHNIQCQYCHYQVDRSKHAGVPDLGTCMNCHSQVATDKPDIQKMSSLFVAGKSVEWARVHMLPDFVHFNHSAHITKGVNCKTCHGEVEKMKTAEQFSDLSMGWCVNCHRQPENKAPLNCSTCHY